MIQLIKFALFLLIILFPFFSQITSNAEIKNIISLNQLMEQADSLFNSRKYAESREIYRQIADKAEKSKDNSALAEAYSMIARTFLILDKKEIGRDWIIKAGEIASIKDPLGWSRYLGVRGRFEWQDNEPEKAVSTFENMYRFCSAQKLHERAIDAAHMVAIVGDPEQQVKWAKKGIAEAEAGNVTKWLGPLWNNLGYTYEDLKQFDLAVDAYLKARDYHYKYGDDTNKMIADWVVGHAYRLNNNIPEAEKWMQPVLDWAIKLDNIEFIGWAHNELGEIALRQDNLISALSHFDLASNYLGKADMPNWDPEQFQRLQAKIQELKDSLTAAND